MDLLGCAWLLLLAFPLAAGLCQEGQFYSEVNRTCQKCSKCPPNQIIKKLCEGVSDTKCKPFSEFIDFNNQQGIEVDYVPVPAGDSRSDDVIKIEEIPAITKDEGEYWRNLAFALIAVLCALIIVATIIVLCACRKLHETAALKRPEEEDGDDTDSGYVVIRQIRYPPLKGQPRPTTSEQAASHFQSSRHQKMPWLYKPKRRLLNEYVDDVFESEDSAGSRISRKLPLSVIHERESEESPCESV